LMVPSWSDVLWISLILLMASAPMGRWSRAWALASLGWVTFGIYWLAKPWSYLAMEDYFNALLTVAAALLCFYIARIIASKGLASQEPSKACTWISYAAAICGLIYFPFAEIAPLQAWLIGQTTSVTIALLEAFSIPVIRVGVNTMVLNGRSVQIILACTAIESIALFVGLILSVRAPIHRRAAALAVSIMAIYSLNIVRNAFVLMAYGDGWFGDDSFYVAHNVIAKAGSMVALLAVAYVVLTVLPELLNIMDELAWEIKHPGGAA
jgi:archaeosortase A